MRYLSGKNIDEIRLGYLDTMEQIDALFLLILHKFLPNLKTNTGKNYCTYGLARRTSGIRKCLERFYKIFEKECAGEQISDDERFEETAFLNYFLLNISGGMDNLAWVIVEEKKLGIPAIKVSLLHKEMKPHLAQRLKTEIAKYTDWLNYLKSFRDPAAHRIPPYVIPHIQFHNGTQTYDSYYTHDFDESPRVPLHPQVIVDARTFHEIVRVGIESFFEPPEI